MARLLGSRPTQSALQRGDVRDSLELGSCANSALPGNQPKLEDGEGTTRGEATAILPVLEALCEQGFERRQGVIRARRGGIRGDIHDQAFVLLRQLASATRVHART